MTSGSTTAKLSSTLGCSTCYARFITLITELEIKPPTDSTSITPPVALTRTPFREHALRNSMSSPERLRRD